MAALMLGRVLPVCALIACAAPVCSAIESEEDISFSIVTYNVENLFDVDGVALFDDYLMDGDSDPFGYSRSKFLTKLRTIAAVLKTVNQGAGPEVILFQELEADFSPGNSPAGADALVRRYADTTVAAMLTDEWADDFAGYSSAAWLLKTLSEQGMTGYSVATVPAGGPESGVAHTNAIFSKFPLRQVRRHALLQARDILEAELDIQGHPLYVYVNHWKSGASNPEREPIRVDNARVLRGLIDARLKENPQADIVVAGDLNSHYNHSLLYPEIVTGINDVLGSGGDEAFGRHDLYNLWFELPPEQRYSEVWRGRRGSLMHMLLTRGLYDDSGISYLDGSYDKLLIPGLNADAIGRPLKWHFSGETGGGASDHLPVHARFTTAPFQATGERSGGDDALTRELPLGVTRDNAPSDLPDAGSLNGLSDTELAPLVGHLFTAQATVISLKPLRLQVNRTKWSAYYVNRSMMGAGGLPAYLENEAGRVRLVVRPGFYRGKRQLVIENILGSW